MPIKTVLHLDVTVRGDVVKQRNLLMVQIRAPPGAVLRTFSVSPCADDTNKVDVDVDIDENVSKGRCRLKQRWCLLNPTLAEELARALSTQCKKDAVAGSNPRHEADEATFSWPDGLKSTLHPIDPYTIGFHREATDVGKFLLEIECVPTKLRDGKEVSPILVTAFFLVDLPWQDPEYGDLEIDESQDEEEKRRLRRARLNNKRGRGRADDMDVDFQFFDDEDDDGGGKPPAKGTPKKGGNPGAAAAGMFSFLFLAGACTGTAAVGAPALAGAFS